jgi:hypothetical protein
LRSSEAPLFSRGRYGREISPGAPSSSRGHATRQKGAALNTFLVAVPATAKRCEG